MNKEDIQNFASPKVSNVKRLGMKRLSNMLTDNVNSMTPIASGSARSIRRTHSTPQSDAKVNYNTVSPLTPYVDDAQHRDIERRTASENCRPFRLSLSKKLGAKMTKKKLQFHSANEEHKSDDGTINNDERVDSGDIEGGVATECVESLSTSSLISGIVDMREELEARQRHAERVTKLKRDIEVWKTGFSTALNDLQKQLQPQMDVETTLQKLNIDPQMIKYVED